MTNQQGAPEALPPTWAQDLSIAISLLGLARVGKVPSDAASNARWRLNELSRALTALVEAQQPAAHVQNPAEIEHVAGDVSKNRPGSNMAQQAAPSAAAANVCTDCNNADSWGLPDKPCCRTCTGSSNWEPLNKSSVHPNAQTAAPQPSPTPQADSQPAPVVGTIAHVGTGKTTLTGAITSALRAARAPADSVTAPAESDWDMRGQLAYLLLETDGKQHPHMGAVAFQEACEAFILDHGADVLNLLSGEPTQAQAGAVPLTKEQRSRIVLTADTVSEAIDMVERHHGIKGGQHG